MLGFRPSIIFTQRENLQSEVLTKEQCKAEPRVLLTVVLSAGCLACIRHPGEAHWPTNVTGRSIPILAVISTSLYQANNTRVQQLAGCRRCGLLRFNCLVTCKSRTLSKRTLRTQKVDCSNRVVESDFGYSSAQIPLRSGDIGTE
jgi:hypothetical protein